ncbi:uncharacterized protein LOC113167776 isoform X3 [Anabas testudineus]|uniref:uncharacterized protein LOC113167776 isoform X3 n=1 Tax=Anabas testudineus TaxID=64144 RepID=UPI000E45A903|nr:uncharacterized protein LOC113167776 isoform X3 [Anabas testudineus]
MDEISPLLGNQPQESPDLLSPNLRPRHQELIPTPCGPIKRWSELSCLLKLYFCFTVASLLVLLGLTLTSIYKQRMTTEVTDEDNFTVSLIQLVGILFCFYYISRGVLQENRQELMAFVLTVLVLIVRSVVNFSVLGSKGKQELLVRFVCIMCLGGVHVVCTLLLFRRPNMMAFRVGGALESLQLQYFLLNLCFSMVTFDLQAQNHPRCRRGLGLPDRRCRRRCSFKGSQGLGLGLHGAEPPSVSLLWLRSVHVGGEMVSGWHIHPGGSCCHWSCGFTVFAPSK